jgi:long-chain acyl-CoA synthetase
MGKDSNMLSPYRQGISEARTLGFLIDALAEHGDRQAVLALQEEGAESWTYDELAAHVRRLAHGLTKVGVSPGDHVMLFAPSQPEWMVACLATIGAGAVATPVDVQLGDEVLGRILDHSGAEFVFTTAEQAGRFERIDVKLRPRPILLDVGEEDPRSWRHLLATEDPRPELARPEPDETAALFYTSGTTGAPKGVPLSHSNLAFQIEAILGANVVTESDHMLVPLPLHHVYPFVMGMLSPLTLGLTIVLPQSLTGPQLVRALQEGEVSVIVGVPRLYSALYAGIEERARSGGKIAAALFGTSAGLSTWVRRKTGLDAGRVVMRPLRERLGPGLRILASGGAPLDQGLAQKLEGMGWRIVIGYGLTETAPLLALKRADGKKLGSVGQPMPGVDVRLDPSAVPGEDSPSEKPLTSEPYKEGEILARGPGIFSGYLNLPKETEDVLTKDGWFRTRDLGHFDEDGYLYVTGRASTLIVTEGGKNIQPEEVEEAYLGNPIIREIGVLQRDSRLVAVIMPDLDEIRRRTAEIDRSIRQAVEGVSDRLPSYQRISEYAITHLPLERTQLGKIRRHLLEERYDAAKSGAEGMGEAVGPISIEEMPGADRELLENPAAREVWGLLARRYSDRYLTPDTSPQLDLGIDSLGWMDLTLEIDQSAGVELSEEAIGRIYTVRELLHEVAEQAEAGGSSEPQALPLEQPEAVLSEYQKRSLEPFGPVKTTAARGMFALNRVIAQKVFGLSIHGLEHLPREGSFVLTPNHVSSLDPGAIAAALDYRHLRHIYWAGRSDTAFSNPLKRLFGRLGHVVPIDSHRAVFSSLAFGAAVLKRQEKLVWFPEGHRSHTGELQPFRPGIGVLLDRFPVPVVPVFVRGTYEAMPPGKAWPRPRKLTITFGKPLDPRELEQQGEGERPQDRIVHALFEHVAKLGSVQA